MSNGSLIVVTEAVGELEEAGADELPLDAIDTEVSPISIKHRECKEDHRTGKRSLYPHFRLACAHDRH